MAKVDEFIWRITPQLKRSHVLIHQEKDVELDVPSLSLSKDRAAIANMIRGLIGQDAKCSYSDKLTVLPFSCGSNWIWAIAGGHTKSRGYFLVLLIPIR